MTRWLKTLVVTVESGPSTRSATSARLLAPADDDRAASATACGNKLATPYPTAGPRLVPQIAKEDDEVFAGSDGPRSA